MEKVKGHARGSESNTIFQKPQKGVCLSVLSFVTFSRPQFQSYEVETLHAASSHEGDERRSFKWEREHERRSEIYFLNKRRTYDARNFRNKKVGIKRKEIKCATQPF